MNRQLADRLGPAALLACTLMVVAAISGIGWVLVQGGGGALSWEFVFGKPQKAMTAGGILPAVSGTVVLTLVTALVATPFGIGSAIYLNEYARNTLLTRIVRASIRNLAGIPSIIYGLFGLALFVQGLGLGTSLLASGLTLGLLSLPYVITTTEEALRAVPLSIREAALALGATRFETIRDLVVPQAVPGILTGVVLALSRAAGETAPILFTGVAFYTTRTQVRMDQEFMALPYHVYMLSTQHQAIEQVRPLAYATALVLLLVVFLLNLIAFLIRARRSPQA